MWRHYQSVCETLEREREFIQLQKQSVQDQVIMFARISLNLYPTLSLDVMTTICYRASVRSPGATKKAAGQPKIMMQLSGKQP